MPYPKDEPYDPAVDPPEILIDMRGVFNKTGGNTPGEEVLKLAMAKDPQKFAERLARMEMEWMQVVSVRQGRAVEVKAVAEADLGTDQAEKLIDRLLGEIEEESARG